MFDKNNAQKKKNKIICSSFLNRAKLFFTGFNTGMNISDRNHVTPYFEGRVRLKDTRQILAPKVVGQTKLDNMFKENRGVKAFENLSIYLKQDLVNRHFLNPTNRITKGIKTVLDKSVGLSRKIADKIFFVSQRNAIKNLNKNFVNINPESAEYIEELAQVGNSMGKQFVITNIEDKPLKDLSKSKNAAIFVMNHPNYHKDKFTYMILNSMLNKMYVEEGRQATCPRPKIIVSRNMLKLLGKKVGNIYKHLGLTEVDASLGKRDNAFNAKSMRKLMREFVQNKSNIFIFPEGNNSAFKDKCLEEKLQSGIGEFVKTALKIKGKVRIIPVGIKYTEEKNSFGNIFIGKPIHLKEEGKDIIYTEGTSKKKIKHCTEKDVKSNIMSEILKNIKYGIEKASDMG